MAYTVDYLVYTLDWLVCTWDLMVNTEGSMEYIGDSTESTVDLMACTAG